jgi:anti-sigma factor RsiW
MLDNMLCHQFEDLLTDYLDGTLDRDTHRRVAAHALRCPVCHELLNEVKAAVHACHTAPVPLPSTQMEARILQMTMPETAIHCEEFEALLTDYLDGFLPAAVFHRWERHAVLCSSCTNLPGEVVRSIGACYTYKAEELPVPAGLHERILQATLGTAEAKAVKMSVWSQIQQTLENAFKPLFSPLLTPQFASVAMMLLMAFVVFTNVAATDGSIGGVYQKGLGLAVQTYQQSADAVGSGLSEGLNLEPKPEEVPQPTSAEETKNKES